MPHPPEKQYHNRFTERGKEVWDVDRLLELARTLSPKAVLLSDISELDEVYWFDDEFRPTCRAVVEHVRRIDAVDLSDPIVLSADGRVMDGMHRVAKAALLRLETIQAVQFGETPPPDHVDPPG